MTRCPSCKTRFSSEARFCPFDGEALEATGEDEAPDPLIGKVIDGRYEVGQLLGEGGMGKVYEVRHSALGRNFAMKVLREDLSREGELGARFTREARAAAAIEHPNVVQITDFGSLDSAQPYFVMERLEGRPLSRLLRQGPLTVRRALHIVAQVARGLHAAHQAGIIHRDLKPDNIVVRPVPKGDDVKVVDFGLARVAGQSRLTKGGMVFGTPHYMSPEQAMGDELDARSDQYALGVILYEAVTGAVPFEADTYMGVMTQHVYAEPRPPHDVSGAAAVGPAVEAAILKCLAKKPHERFASMTELADRLEELAEGDDVDVHRRPSPRIAEPPDPETLVRRPVPRRTSGWLVAAGLLTAGGALVLGWVIAGLDDAPNAERAVAPSGTNASAGGSITASVRSSADRPLPTVEPSRDAPTSAAAPRPGSPKTVGAGAPRPSVRVAPAPSAPETSPDPAPSPKSAKRPSRLDPRFRGSDIVDPWSQ